VAADLVVTRPARLRRLWLIATVALTVLPVLIAVVFAPATGTTKATGLVWLLFAGSSMHIGATGWFYTVPEVRGFMAGHPGRYYLGPLGLIVLGAVLAASLSPGALAWVLLAFFGWQFFHFQKQNLGVAALAAQASSAGRLGRIERGALTAAGIGGIAALLGTPALLDVHPGLQLPLLVPAGTAVFAGAVVVGAVAVARRAPGTRPASYLVVYLVSLVFFAPVFVFDSPFAAVAGITIAHGLQYLLLVGLLATSPASATRPLVGALVLANLALVLGLALNAASHLHDGGALARAVYGGYLGVLTAHFVIDAGLWRLREEFPRAFLSERLPYLLAR
jgi:hypothetical protein